MKEKNFYSVGTIVSLFNTKQRLMIAGYLQRNNQSDKIWDYVGVVYPAGFLTPNRMVLFDHEQVENIYYVGCQNVESLKFIDAIKKQAARGDELL